VIAIGLLVLVAVIPIAGLEKMVRIIVIIVILNQIIEEECVNHFRKKIFSIKKENENEKDD